jgi:hypothetical protein
MGKLIDFLRKPFKKKLVDRPTGVMCARDLYTCPSCKTQLTKEEVDRNWDWGGPHCPHCGSEGMSMFADIIEQDCPKGIRSARDQGGKD